MNSYSVLYLSCEMLEIDADYYQVDGADLVFFSGTNEVLRAPSTAVAGVTKTSTRQSVSTPITEQILL